ncbi:uncharacterized protein [Drosophila tropicalis]|uniref:uncharacterized protein isoform X2 n=1 Tax=Drosophila tropicalis TaxID=46794 RepID=UPI0035AC1353
MRTVNHVVSYYNKNATNFKSESTTTLKPEVNEYLAFSFSYSVYLVLIVLFCCLCFVYCKCCYFGNNRPVETPVVVTSATHTAPGGYPVTQLPPPGYPPNPPNVYSPAPYPAQTTGNVTVQMPMPQPGMPTHGVTPYPPMPQPGSMNPPSYDMAVASPGPSVIPSSYEKQAPYNPTYGQ